MLSNTGSVKSNTQNLMNSQQDINTLRSFGSQMGQMHNEGIVNNIGRYDKNLMSWLVSFHNALSGDTINMNEINNAFEVLEKIREKTKNQYLIDLLYPEYARNAKIPLEFPIPTSSFQIHNQISVNTNALGNLAIIFNPFFLEQGAATNSTFYLNNDASLNGSAASNFFTATQIGTTVPLVIYQKYRLVSAAFHARYIFRLDSASGVFGGAINFETVSSTANGGVLASLARYGNFNLIDDSYFSTRSNPLDGMRLLYIPYDPSTEEFNNLGTSKSSTNFLFYAQGFPPSQSAIRIDVYLNYETVLDPEFQNFVPTTMAAPSTSQEIRNSVDYATKNGKVTTTVSDYEKNSQKEKKQLQETGGFLDTVLEGAKSLLPSIGDIAGYLMKGLGGIFF